MEQITFSDTDRIIAKNKAAELGILNKSITKGAGNLASQLGEIAACRYLNAPYGNATYNYDLIFNGLRIDVKTKNCTSKPRENYLVTVATITKKQNCDIYLFVRVLQPNYDMGWLLGWIKSDEFFNKATFFKKGEVDPTGNGIWKFTEDCFNLPIRELNHISSLKTLSLLQDL